MAAIGAKKYMAIIRKICVAFAPSANKSSNLSYDKEAIFLQRWGGRRDSSVGKNVGFANYFPAVGSIFWVWFYLIQYCT
jgi:hypothetical protein